jgi:predicted O-linked N-acetylglucosamine transferase (SPINDLY family)
MLAAGRRMLSRMGASLAAALGMPDLVTRTADDYVDVAT